MNVKKNITIDFPPQIQVRWGHGKQNAKYIESIFENKLNDQLSFADELAKYSDNFERIPCEATDSNSPHWQQNWFPPLDGMSLYTILATRHPKQYVEIGSGNSTKFARKSVLEQNLTTSITSIDPCPRAEIDVISDVVIRKGLEDTDLSIFESLGTSDVVFFDGSHRSFQNSDVTTFFIDVIPRLATGVTVGMHDIFWPRDYPQGWLDRYYNEQYLLGSYILAQKQQFPLVFACNYMSVNHQDYLRKCLTHSLVETFKEAKKRVSGGAIWFTIL